MKSWKTTTAAILGFVALVSTQAQAALDGDPATIANWNLVITGLAPLIGLLFAKDHDNHKAA